MASVPLILVSNDDGIHSAGLTALADAMAKVGEVVVVAPDREQSACSHALTLHRPLRIDEIAAGRWTVDGTPTDCVNLGVNGILPIRPELLVSGINKGANLGDDVTYSGTVSAAMEGTLLGMKLLFDSSLLGLVSFGDVRYSRLSDEGDGYVIGVRFLQQDHLTQEVLARHIVHRQAEARRERLARDAAAGTDPF